MDCKNIASKKKVSSYKFMTEKSDNFDNRVKVFILSSRKERKGISKFQCWGESYENVSSNYKSSYYIILKNLWSRRKENLFNPYPRDFILRVIALD